MSKGINVLSLFDGISCGRVALERAGVKVNQYFASEVDKSAMRIALSNYPDTIELGDVTKINSQDLPEIDLIIGGSPCQGFSSAGKQLNFEDPRSKLFFEFVRLVKEKKPKWFLLENVKMAQEHQDIISDYLGVRPIEINSKLVSAQNRVRLYWHNIPNVEPLDDKGILLSSILESGYTERQKSFCCMASGYPSPRHSYKQRYLSKNIGQCKLKLPKKKEDITIDDLEILSPVEWERLQTLPDNYTSSVSASKRYKAIGNGWTVDVIAHIFKHLPEI